MVGILTHKEARPKAHNRAHGQPQVTEPLRFLDGPKFVEFLEANGVTRIGLSESESRKWTYWQEGSRADSYSSLVDGLLTRYGLPHSYIPDEVWAADQTHHNARRKPAKKRKRRVTSKKRAEVIEMLAAGCSARFVSEILDLDRKMVATIGREEGVYDPKKQRGIKRSDV